jgi:beta-glucosidase
MLKKFAAYPGICKLIVTENGAAFPDDVENGAVKDVRRTEYLQQYVAQILKAKKEGVPVAGHFVWTFTDNFEWAEGYRPRFGLVYVDFKTQQRIVKQSGYWYRDFIRGKMLTVPPLVHSLSFAANAATLPRTANNRSAA